MRARAVVCDEVPPRSASAPTATPSRPGRRADRTGVAPRWAWRRAPHVALLECLGALRPRPHRAGRGAHAPGPARDAGAWVRRRRAGGQQRPRPRRVIGRLATGLVVDRLNRRLVASATLAIQVAGLALLARAPSSTAASMPDARCSGWVSGKPDDAAGPHPGRRVATRALRRRLVGLVVGINQFHVRVRPVPRRYSARPGGHLRAGPRRVHRAASARRADDPAGPGPSRPKPSGPPVDG